MIGIDKFLGAGAGEGGPFALLGIAPEQCTNVAVIAALERQLDRIDQHPQGDTPEAEEVRLALHAAAAQLLDPLVRRHLLQRVRPDLVIANGDVPAFTTGHAPTADVASPRAVGGLEQDAILTLARLGGINSESMRRLAALAHARGLDSRHAAQALQHLARRRPMNVDRPPSAAFELAGEPAPAPQRAQLSPETAQALAAVRQKRAWQAAIVGCLLLVSLISLAALVAVVLAHRPAPAPSVKTTGREPVAPLPQPAPPAPSEPELQEEPQPAPEPRLITGGPELLEALRDARAGLDAEPESALDDFAFAVRSLAAAWPQLDEGQRRAAHHAILEFLYAANAWSDVREGAFDVIARPSARLAAGEPALEAREVAPAIWSVGMLARLSDERELSVHATTAVRRALIETIGSDRAGVGSFENGARAAAAAAPLAIVRADRLDDSADAAREAIEAWRQAVDALYADPAAREGALVDGLEQILIDAAEPSADPRVLASIRALVVAIAFAPEGPARPRLVEWFRHPRISSDDMAEVTGALAATSVEGVDSVMVLSRSAGRDDRLEMATAYSKAWGMEAAAITDEFARQWIESAHKALAQEADSADLVDALARAVRFARLNEVARRTWRGERSGLGPILDAAMAPDQGAPALGLLLPSHNYEDSSAGTDGQWALRYRAARQNIPVRLELLDEIGRAGGAIGPINAEVLAEEAFFGTPTDRIRPKAQEIAIQFADDPAMVLAILEVLPRRRTILPDMARMISTMTGESLGDHEDPLWPLRARRALVQRSLELLAPESRYARIDPLVAALSTSYEHRAGASAGRADRGPIRPSIAAERLIVAARDLWDAVLLEADSVTAHDEGPIARDVVERRRRGRQSLARGPTQAFAAEQISIAELLAWTVAGEQRSRAAEVGEVMAEMTSARQAAVHVYQQIEAAERAMLQLWLIRFGEEPAP